MPIYTAGVETLAERQGASYMRAQAHFSPSYMESRMSTARTILIIDDDEDLRETLIDQLAMHDEFATLSAESASDGRGGRRGA